MKTIRIFAMMYALGLPSASAAQQPRMLPPPDAQVNETFSDISSVRELSNGTVLVADRREKRVSLVDFRSQVITPIGAEGSGPGEYRFPSRLFAVRGDSSYLFDPANARFLVLGPNGRPIGSFRPEASDENASAMLTAMEPLAADESGRIYYRMFPRRFRRAGEPVTVDSVPLVRYDRRTRQLDTVVLLRAPAMTRTETPDGGNRVALANPLLPRDAFAITPRGQAAVVRAPEYRVDWVRENGQVSKGTEIRFTPVRVTQAVRDAFYKSLESFADYNILRSDAGASITPATTRRQALTFEEWPTETSPLSPFPIMSSAILSAPLGEGAAVALPDGRLWVRRSEGVGAMGALIDVINAGGMLAYQVRIPPNVTVVGFGNGAVYTTSSDADGLQTLRRHKLP